MSDDDASVSRERTIFVCYRFFFKQLQRRYMEEGQYLQIVLNGTTMMRAGGFGYSIVCIWWYRTEESDDGAVCTASYQGQDRTECFDDHYFPCRKPECDRKHVWNWLKLFLLYYLYLYLHTGADRVRFTTFLARDGG